MNIALVPSSHIYLKDSIFSEGYRDDALYAFRLLKETLNSYGWRCHTYDMYSSMAEIDYLICYRIDVNLPVIKNVVSENKHVKLIHIMHEPPIVCPLHVWNVVRYLPFDLQLALNDDLCDRGNLIKKICYAITPTTPLEIPSIDFDKRKFIATVAGAKSSNEKNELYSERVSAVKFFSKKTTGFDLYGVGWSEVEDKILLQSYKGTVDHKVDVLKRYKFALCYENCSGVRGYITEKIFDCLAAGTVPIYYGAPNIQDYVPKDCFIDFRDFAGYEDLYSFLYDMSEERYNRYVESGKRYVASPQYQENTAQGYAQTIVRGLKEIQGVRVKRGVFKLRLTLFGVVIRNSLLFTKNINQMRRLIFSLIS